jgi:acyl-CoA thioester hydrolase
MFIAETKLRVRYAETDQMGIVYHGNYFEFFEVARVEAIRQLGYTYADMEKEGVVMPIVEVHARYLRPALYDELLTIKTILKEMPVNYKIEFHHEVLNENDELLTTGRVILFFMESKTKKRHVMPENLSRKLQSYFS